MRMLAEVGEMIGQLGVEEVIGVSVHHRDRMRRLRLPQRIRVATMSPSRRY